jgi:hypothetical protein
MDNSALIVLFIVLGIVVVVYLLRDRLTRLRAKASVDKREGELEVEAAEPQPLATSSQPTDPPSINISGNKTFGKTRVKIERDDVGVTGNTLLGSTQIEVKDSAAKKPRK